MRLLLFGALATSALGAYITNQGDASWLAASNYCIAQGKNLCSAAEYCPGGAGSIPAYGDTVADVWAPTSDKYNQWIQVGHHSVGTAHRCVVHDDTIMGGALPSWGITGGCCTDPLVTHFQCCGGGYVNTLGDLSWSGASAHCGSLNKQLCSAAKYCPGGAESVPVFGDMLTDVWAPTSDKSNQWIQVGQHNVGTTHRCRLHDDTIITNPGELPLWGISGGCCTDPRVTHFKCCDNDLKDGTYTIMHNINNRYLDAHQGSSNDYSAVTRALEGDDTQKWIIKRTGSGEFTIQEKSNNRYLDAYTNGDGHSAVTRNENTGTGDAHPDTQRWLITLIGGVYTLQHKTNNRFLDAYTTATGNPNWSAMTRISATDGTQTWTITESVDCVGSWASYGTCSATCGVGQQTRSFDVTTNPSNFGAACLANQGATETRTCNTVSCPGYWGVIGSQDITDKPNECVAKAFTTSEVTNSQGNYMGVTCCNSNGAGSRPSCNWENVDYDTALTKCENKGKRLCTVAEIQGGAGKADGCGFDSLLVWTSDSCPPPAAVNCVGSYGSWSTCSTTCGTGSQTNTFSITTQAAHRGAACNHADGDTQTQNCETNACPVDCVGSWASYGTCSATCDVGQQTRSFVVTTDPSNGGAACLANQGATETRICNTESCPGYWGIIGRQSGRSDSSGRIKLDECVAKAYTTSETSNNNGNEMGVVCCNSNGKGTRPNCKQDVGYDAALAHCNSKSLRLCTVAEIEGGSGEGEGCGYDAYLVWTSDSCPPPAPVDCVGTYGSWSTCSTTCGTGSQTNTFSITTQAAHRGAACNHADGDTQTQNCETNACPVNCVGSWGSYSICSKTCGSGTQSQTYSHTTLPTNGGAACPTLDGATSSRTCHTTGCPIHCVGSWGSYGTCSKTCKSGSGAGSATRTFAITTAAANGGAACVAADGGTSTGACNTNVCPGMGWTSVNPASDCRNVASTESGMYYLQATASSSVVHTFCDLVSSDGPWMLIGHIKRGTSNFVWPGRVTAGSDPDSLGFSIKADGFHFDGIRLSHNGQPDTVTKMFKQSYEYIESQTNKVYEQTDGRYSILELKNRAGSASGRIPLAVLGSTRTDGFHQSRTAASGAVSSSNGECSTLNNGDGTNSACGGWPNGNTEWTVKGGKIFIRTSVSVDCVGSWGSYSACSKTCSTGVQTGTYTISTAATNAGTACPAADGATHTRACKTVVCPGLGWTLANPAGDCREVASTESGMYYLQATASSTVIYTFCDLASSDGPWMLIGHIKRGTSNFVWPGKETAGSPDSLGFSIKADGFHFDGIRLSHNGRSDTVTKMFTQSYEYLESQKDKVYEQTDGRYSILEKYNRIGSSAGRIPLACLGSTNVDCFNQRRNVASGAVSSSTGECSTLNSNAHRNSDCGGWPNGNTEWTSQGGKIFIRTSSSVDCVGSWSSYTTCSKTCGTGGQTQTYSITTAATNAGVVCPTANGATQTRACSTNACPVDCVGAWSGYTSCSKTCGTGMQTKSYAHSVLAAHAGVACPVSNGVTSTRSCHTAGCPVHCAGSWGLYQTCSKTCAVGSQTRTFAVSTASENGGSLCLDSDGATETRVCNTNHCPGRGSTSDNPAGDCREVAGTASGMYYLQATDISSVIYTYCDMTSSDGPWMLIAHVKRKASPFVWPGKDTAGDNNPDSLGFSVKADGFHFDGIRLTHNGQSDQVTKMLKQSYEFVETQKDKVYEQTDGKYSILEKFNRAGSNGRIPLACLGSTNTDCFNQQRNVASGAVSDSTGECSNLRAGGESNNICGGWPNGNKEWASKGGKIFIRTSVSVDCIGTWGSYSTTCTKTCGGGILTKTFTISTAATNAGTSCPYSDGATKTKSCSVDPCPVNCVGSWGVYATCSKLCDEGVQSRTFVVETPDSNGGSLCQLEGGAIETQLCNTDGCDDNYNVKLGKGHIKIEKGYFNLKKNSKKWKFTITCDEASKGKQKLLRYTKSKASHSSICNRIEIDFQCDGFTYVVVCKEQSDEQKFAPLAGGGDVEIDLTPIVFTDVGGGDCRDAGGLYLPWGSETTTNTTAHGKCSAQVSCLGYMNIYPSADLASYTQYYCSSIEGVCTNAGNGATAITTGNDPNADSTGRRCIMKGEPTVNCAGSWASYSDCSKTCNVGWQSRTYTITTHPANGGTVCPEEETIDCNTPICPTPNPDPTPEPAPTPAVNCAGVWDSFGTCSKTCGSGSQTRTFTISTNPSNGGSPCPAGETRACNTPVCVVDCVGSWDVYGTCTKTCGSGTETRTYTVTTNPENSGVACPADQTRVCNTGPCPVDCAGFWVSYGTCSKTCGSGSQTRTFTITTNPLDGGSPCPADETRVCNTPGCVIDCGGSWAAFDTCTKTCGTGSQTRTFTVSTVAQHGGDTCPSPETRACNTVGCPVHCVGSWVNYGACTKTCGTGSQTRSYAITTYGGANGGTACPADETRACGTNDCAVHCTGYWAFYDTCTKTCGTGSQTRTYTVTQQEQNGGDACPLPETQTCNTVACPVHCAGSWEAFGACSKTCGTGSQTRTFSISTNPSNGGTDCPADETRVCSTVGCPVHCAGSWDSYGGCSKTCGTGSQTRTYTISTNPLNGGTECPADETRACSTVNCPIHCVGSWSGFGSCSKSCNIGSQTRTYVITTEPDNDGSPCDTIHGFLNSQQCNTYGCGEIFAYDYSLKAATHWFSPTVLRLPDPAGALVIDITIACTAIEKGPRTIVRYNQAIGGSHAEVCAKTVINFSCTGWTFTKSCGEQSTLKKMSFLDNAGGDIVVTLTPDPCAFNDVTFPSGSTASGTNCQSGGSVVSNSGCAVSNGTETCQPIKCTAGVWSSTAPSCPGVCLENKDPVCSHDDMGACDSFGRRCHMDSAGGHCWKLTAGTCLSSSGSSNTPYFVTSNLYEGTCGVLELKVEVNPTPDSTPDTPEDSPDSPDETQTPGGTPTPEPTGSPEDTPDATNTPDPTGSPDDTPDATPTPVPTQSPDDTAAPSPTPSPVTTYQWLWSNSSDGSGATEISGATSGTYQPTNDDAGRYLFVDVSAPGEDIVRLKSFHIGSSASCSSGASSGVPFSTRLSSQSLRMLPRGRNRARL